MDIDSAIDLLGKAIDRQLAAFAGVSEIASSNQDSHQLVIHTFTGIA